MTRYRKSHWNKDFSAKIGYKTSHEANNVIMNKLRPKNPDKLFSFYKCSYAKCDLWHIGFDRDKTKEYLNE